ncbi:hypothetical protein DXV75_14310 [Alteromonas aestuariivivens]|uniref:Uncharacterized protein n=1 Tax=Alteromonas aestuariivivens TaxID=1938339 RepID=A0A3D8M417_9ALTE|nr:hypothetical protein [Alteromonas aestuariivivens]RDV24386.1 hypothetical protein DXV75_14310 [Alteromonas aestuariivivens]
MRQNQNLYQKLMNVCQQLHNQGKQPTVALLRARAPVKVSLSEAIEALRQYNLLSETMSKEDLNSFTNQEVSQDEGNVASVSSQEERISRLEHEVSELKAQLAKIEMHLINTGD